MAAKYSYRYKFIKAFPKYGISIGDEQFFDKKKGDKLVKEGICKFEGKYELKFDPKHGTVLAKVVK